MSKETRFLLLSRRTNLMSDSKLLMKWTLLFSEDFKSSQALNFWTAPSDPGSPGSNPSWQGLSETDDWHKYIGQYLTI